MEVKDEITESGGVHAHVDGRFDLIPPEALRVIALVMEEGVRNGREDNNWRRVPVNLQINHALAHIVAWMNHEDDEDHLAHALTRLAFAVSIRCEDLRHKEMVDGRIPGPAPSGECDFKEGINEL